MEDSSSISFLSHLSNYSSAKIKLDELFCQFIRAEGSKNIIALIQEAQQALLNDNDNSSVSSNEGGSSGHTNRSPLISKKSPKKRTQSEISSSNARTSPPTSSSSSPVTIPVSDLNRLSISSDEFDPNFESISAHSGSTLTNATNNVLQDAVDDTDEEEEDNLEKERTIPRRRANFDSIPTFYLPNKKNNFLYAHYYSNEDDKLSKKLSEIEAFFKPFPQGIPVEKFVHVTKRLCGIPSFFNLPLCRRINELYSDNPTDIPPPRTVIGRSLSANRQACGVKIQLKTFLKFWSAEIEPFDRMERFFRIIKKPTASTIEKDDFIPFLQELLHFHPGLDFLENHEEFQRKYALTVITRVFYKVNTSRTGKITLNELRKSNLFAECMHVDEETDINKVLDYFSYEHFYVIYCKFFELDYDKDSKLQKADVMKYGEHALSEVIVDRIFHMGNRVFTDGEIGGFDASGGMTYPDFVFFMLSEEDKTSEIALKYWFTCCDLDGDGKLTSEEMRYFYHNQIHRITSLGQESINFEDVLCQMMDMVSPSNPTSITLDDLLRPDKRMISGVLFDVMFNLHKFMRFESRDPFQEKLRREDLLYPTDWDKFAHVEYNRLAQEEEENYDATNMDLDGAVGAGTDGAGGAGSGGGAENHWSLHDEEESDSEDYDNDSHDDLLMQTTTLKHK